MQVLNLIGKPNNQANSNASDQPNKIKLCFFLIEVTAKDQFNNTIMTPLVPLEIIDVASEKTERKEFPLIKKKSNIGSNQRIKGWTQIFITITYKWKIINSPDDFE